MRSKSSPSDIQRELGYLVGSLASAMRIGLDRELAPFNISSAQWAILDACHEGEADTLTSLSRVIPLDSASISRHVDRLVRVGLVHRSRSTRDRRLVRLSLTDAGNRLVPELAQRVQANNAKFLAGITKREQEAMMRTIRRMLESAQAAVYEGDD
ncbi:MAG: MarR family transcriptional regulator [Chloroflexota bacterium]|nr:MarR family transcriptional regulator [Chloroflexota bacterium]MDE2918710.1 MarR family transcriptional regulator [Chloroflexota bacterium]